MAKIELQKYLAIKLKQWTEENYPVGIKLGYPECCVLAFCNDFPESLQHKNSVGERQMRQIRFEASLINDHYSGFIPCTKHAAEIMNKETTLKDLIKNRDSSFKEFPDEWSTI